MSNRSAALRLLLPVLATVLAFAPFTGHAAPPVEGVDYQVIAAPQRWDAGEPAKIEVVEVFGYWCHYCHDFAPMLERWKQAQAADVRVAYVPLPRSADEELSQGFFAAESIGALPRVHADTFTAMHDTHELPTNPTIDELSAFYVGRGVNGARFRAAAAAPAIREQVARARDFAVNSGVEGTPTLVIDGRYRVTTRTLEDSLRVASALVEKVRAERR